MGERGTTKTQLKGVLMLLITAAIWGSAFVAQSVGMQDVREFTFGGIRTLMGAAVLLPVILLSDRRKRRGMDEAQLREEKETDRKTVRYGLVLGVVFCLAGSLQQFAFRYSTAGKIAFITALYIFFVPVLGLFLKKRVPLLTWGCVMFGFVGLYFLCIDPSELGAINRGDLLALACSLFFAVHILLIERFAREVDGVKLSWVQFLVGGTISCVLMFLFESPSLEAIGRAAVPLLYAGVLSCGVAYTFQIVGQKYTEATVASLILCMESVFAVLAAALILNERLTGREMAGCAIMFGAILLSQVSEGLSEKLKKK